jgi:hypothetical protein
LTKDRVSPLENLVLLRGDFLVAKSLRFEGRFKEAEESLYGVHVRAYEPNSPISWKVTSHHGEVLSQLVLYARGIQMVEVDIDTLAKYRPLTHGSGARLRLALANCHLMSLLWIRMQEPQPLAPESVRLALEHFQSLDETRLAHFFKCIATLSKNGASGLLSG